uniref:Putative influenza virus ns1a-binding protein n=1 Tax=Amblyomma cajennense TaxID=34607 RepID=A0A023FCQ5_AMBCJ
MASEVISLLTLFALIVSARGAESPRSDLAAVFCAGICHLDNKVFVVGGWNGKRGLSCCDVFDPLSKIWSSAAPMLLGRYQAGVACLNREVYAVGGCDSWTCVASVEKYNPITNTWMEVAPLQNARRGCGVVEYNGMRVFCAIALSWGRRVGCVWA